LNVGRLEIFCVGLFDGFGQSRGTIGRALSRYDEDRQQESEAQQGFSGHGKDLCQDDEARAATAPWLF
jgi:hypothetical protein